MRHCAGSDRPVSTAVERAPDQGYDGKFQKRRLFKNDHIAGIASALAEAPIRSTTLSSELWTCSRPLYSMKPSFLNLFMKKLTRGRVVPITSARVSWLIFAMIGSGLPSEIRQQQKGAG